MAAGLVNVRGTRLYVETRGERASPAVLYVHGGPGQGCVHFAHAQADLLARDLFVVMVDHRGAMRSDPLPEGAPISAEIVAADLEAVREHLGVETWTLIGHSAGAASALAYLAQWPDRVDALILDCPGLDADLVDRWRLPLAAELLESMGKPDAARRARELAAQPERLSPVTYEVIGELGDRAIELFIRDRDVAADFDRVAEESPWPEEMWRRGTSHAPLLADLYTSRLPLLEGIDRPMMLIRGIDDPVSPPQVVAAVRAAPACERVVELDRSRHFPSFEQPEEYAAAVTAFVRDTVGGSRVSRGPADPG